MGVHGRVDVLNLQTWGLVCSQVRHGTSLEESNSCIMRGGLRALLATYWPDSERMRCGASSFKVQISESQMLGFGFGGSVGRCGGWS